MNLWRVVPLDPDAGERRRGGPLWVPRTWQGSGRHDNPALYGCIYASENPLSAIAEQLAPFRGTGALHEAMLSRLGRPLALVRLKVPDPFDLVDLDDPLTLDRWNLRPSQVATGDRTVTQAQAAQVFEGRDEAAGISWWSTLESSWINATVFDRGATGLVVEAADVLTIEKPLLREAANLIGLAA